MPMELETIIKILFFVLIVFGGLIQQIIAKLAGRRGANDGPAPRELDEESQRQLREMIERAQGREGLPPQAQGPPPVRPVPGQFGPASAPPPIRPVPAPRSSAPPPPLAQGPSPAELQRRREAARAAEQAEAARAAQEAAEAFERQVQAAARAKARAEQEAARQKQAAGIARRREAQAAAQTAAQAQAHPSPKAAGKSAVPQPKKTPRPAGAVRGLDNKRRRDVRVKLNPGNLGKAFALAEILQPPVSLRRDRAMWE